jgi:hypothetical protein
LCKQLVTDPPTPYPTRGPTRISGIDLIQSKINPAELWRKLFGQHKANRPDARPVGHTSASGAELTNGDALMGLGIGKALAAHRPGGLTAVGKDGMSVGSVGRMFAPTDSVDSTDRSAAAVRTSERRAIQRQRARGLAARRANAAATVRVAQEAQAARNRAAAKAAHCSMKIICAALLPQSAAGYKEACNGPALCKTLGVQKKRWVVCSRQCEPACEEGCCC